eukprot:9854620-Alexandrium_andersonii.AAC.1
MHQKSEPYCSALQRYGLETSQITTIIIIIIIIREVLGSVVSVPVVCGSVDRFGSTDIPLRSTG